MVRTWCAVVMVAVVGVARVAESTECPEVDPTNRTVLLPDPQDCTKFLACHWGWPVPMDCPWGTGFDPELETCRPGVCPTDPPTALCSAADPLPRPVPGNCTVFVLCGPDAVPHLTPCPPGLFFNPSLRVCDWPAKSGCVQVTTEPPSEQKKHVDS